VTAQGKGGRSKNLHSMRHTFAGEKLQPAGVKMTIDLEET